MEASWPIINIACEHVSILHLCVSMLQLCVLVYWCLWNASLTRNALYIKSFFSTKYCTSFTVHPLYNSFTHFSPKMQLLIFNMNFYLIFHMIWERETFLLNSFHKYCF